MISFPRLRWTVLTTGAALVMVTSSGCASNQSARAKPQPPAPGINQRLHDDLPVAVRERGVLRVVTDASYAPASSFAPDGRTIIGFEPGLGAALAKVLGIKVTFTNADFAALPGDVVAGRADMIMSAMTDTAKRETALDFVDYFSAGTSLVVQRGNPRGISDLMSLCGQRVAVESSTVQADLLRRQQKQCGDRPISVVTATTNDDALLLLRTGRAAALPMDYPPAENLTSGDRTRANYQLASTVQYEPGPYGIGFAKNQPILRDVVQSALAILIASGTYLNILKEWHVEEGAVATVSLNAAGAR